MPPRRPAPSKPVAVRPGLPRSFSQLAIDLARNHIFSSVRGDQFDSVCERLLTAEQKPTAGRVQLPRRIVVVLGAGASAAGCGLPLGAEAARMLVSRLKRVNRDVFQEEVDRLVLEYHLDTEDFETTLLALSKFDQTTLLSELTNIFGRRFYPSGCYELLAHMVKHRFINAVINFNFDETLDQSLDDELGAGHYDRVTGDGISAAVGDRDARDRTLFARPLYVKPHGTASQKSSMRFTRNSYSLISPDLATLISSLFAQGPTTLIVIGHAMKSIEFNHILRHATDLNVFVIDRDLPQGLDSIVKVKGFIQIPRTDGALNSAVLSLWEEIERAFGPRKPRDIVRHTLIPQLFGFKVDVTQPEEKRPLAHYFHDRTVIELAMAIAKAKGFINVRELANGRAGHYFRLYSKKHSGESLQQMCAKLGLKPVGYSAEVMSLGAPDSDYAAGTSSLIVSPRDFKAAVKVLAMSAVTHSRDREHFHKHLSHIEDTLDKMYKGAEVEVLQGDDVEGHDLFVSPFPLHTLTAVHEKTLQMLESDGWDSVVCVAETGEWLMNPEVRRAIVAKRARVGVIVADTTYKSKLLAAFDGQIKDRFRLLPWWLHNRHLTLLLNGGVPVRGIYFERRLRGSAVVPLSVENEDAKPLLDWYLAYLIKSERYQSRSHEGVITMDEVKRMRARLARSLRGSVPARAQRSRHHVTGAGES